ncbi:MAG: D-tyrosyl-tRNA(Tyr) deacylase [Clostridia bacterium]|nr:D-tyrosyl-tRNA(Tyr) deacylase [Clostridia bacterium]
MKAVIQRVLSADLKVDGKLISEIGQGYVIFLGVKKGDTKETADYFIKKIPPLRICEDENCKINKSIVDTNGEILLVSQFTLYANTSHGNRPDFLSAEAPDKANELYEYVLEGLIKQGLTVKKGVFGADMKINQINDGPFTVILEKDM